MVRLRSVRRFGSRLWNLLEERWNISFKMWVSPSAVRQCLYEDLCRIKEFEEVKDDAHVEKAAW